MTESRPKLDWDRMMKTVREEDRPKEEEALRYYRSERPRLLQSVLEGLKKAETKPSPGLTENSLLLAAKTVDVEQLRRHYNKNRIQLTLTEVHVAIETDADHIILRFLEEMNIKGGAVTIYRLDNEQSIDCEIKGKDVRFALSDLGLTIQEIDQVGLRLTIGDQKVEGKLYEPL